MGSGRLLSWLVRSLEGMNWKVRDKETWEEARDWTDQEWAEHENLFTQERPDITVWTG